LKLAEPAPREMAAAGRCAGNSPPEDSLCASAIVLCGGRSRRMGSDKADLDLLGEALLDRVISQLEPLAAELLLACGPRERYLDRGLPIVLDRVPDAGPLGGIAAGLEVAQQDLVLVVACDMPRLSTRLMRRLLERARKERLDVCWFESERGVEPLCGVYSRRCLEPIRAALAGGRRKVTGFITPELRTGVVRHVELEEDLRRRDCAVNLNTPEELASERDAWASRVVEDVDGLA
jgi:molybdopterin-guanine dinucleotide biosynthesis protein A